MSGDKANIRKISRATFGYRASTVLSKAFLTRTYLETDNIRSGEAVFMARIPRSRAVRKACTHTYISVLFPRRLKNAESGDTCQAPVVFIRAHTYFSVIVIFDGIYRRGSRIPPSRGVSAPARELIAFRGTRGGVSANKENAVGCEGRARDRVPTIDRAEQRRKTHPGYCNSRRTVLIAEYKGALSRIPSIR